MQNASSIIGRTTRGCFFINYDFVRFNYQLCISMRLIRTWCKDENGTEISRILPHRFLYLIRSNSHFRINSNSVRNLEHQIRNRNENGFDIFPTIFYFSTFNSEYPEFKIRFRNSVSLEFQPLKFVFFFIRSRKKMIFIWKL